MYDLNKTYSPSFFARRHRLTWRIPIVCDAIYNVLRPTSLVDFGCGVGGYIQGFLDKGVDAYGIEGTGNCDKYLLCPKDRIALRDLRLPIIFFKKYDLVMSFEVAEHIEEEHSKMYLSNMTGASDHILMTAAPPGQGGIQHVNCKPKSYWANSMECFGYVRDEQIESILISEFTHLHRREINVYTKNMMYFTKKV